MRSTRAVQGSPGPLCPRASREVTLSSIGGHSAGICSAVPWTVAGQREYGAIVDAMEPKSGPFRSLADYVEKGEDVARPSLGPLATRQ